MVDSKIDEKTRKERSNMESKKKEKGMEVPPGEN